MKELKVKYNSGMGAILCSGCNIILKVGSDFTPYEWKAFRGEITLPAQYCNKCKHKNK